MLGFVGVATNTGLVLVTATAMMEEIPFTLPVIRFEIDFSNYLLFFVAVEHLILGLQVMRSRLPSDCR